MIPFISPLISVLCIVGLFAALFMQNKSMMHDRGELSEPSVVQRPAARLIGGVPNTTFAIPYYVLMLLAAWLLNVPLVWYAALAAAVVAAAFSIYLAYSLLFRTRMPCPFCWTGHLVNWTLLALVLIARPR